jgi:hypothetical protein
MVGRVAMGAALCALLIACEKKPEARLKDPPMTARIVTYQKHPMYRIIETPPESAYEETLDLALRTSLAPDGMQQICSQWYPEFGRDVADAFLEWRAKNQTVLEELRQRSTEVWTRRAGADAAYVKMVYPRIRKDVVDALMSQSDTVSVEDFKATCARYPADLRGTKWNLEKRLRLELRSIRERPLSAASAASADTSARSGS